MGVKDVNLRDRHPTEELPAMFSESLSAKNFTKVIWADGFQYSEDYKASVLRGSEISVDPHSSCHQKESSRNPTFPHYPSQVSGHYVIKAVSVENGSEGSCEPEYDAGNQMVVNDVPVSNGLPAQSLFKSKVGPEKAENQVKEIAKTTRSSDVWKGSWIFFNWIIGLCLSFTLIIRVVDAGGTHVGVVFASSIELIGQIPLFSRSSWLQGSRTIQRNGLKDGNMSNQSLWISDREVENYYLEIRLSNGSCLLQQFPIKVMYSCDLELHKEDLNAFKEGRKAVEVELIGEENVTKRYLLKMQNQTLQIYYEQGIERQLQLDHVQCNAAFKGIDPGKSASSGNSPDDKAVKEESSGTGKYVGIGFGVGVAFAVICIILVYLIKLQRRKQDQICNEAAIELSLGSVQEILIVN